MNRRGKILLADKSKKIKGLIIKNPTETFIISTNIHNECLQIINPQYEILSLENCIHLYKMNLLHKR
jgi:hypothetical protein